MKITKPNKKQVISLIKDNILWIIGCSLYSISINCFAVPNSIAQSGISGLAIVSNHLLPALPLGVWNFILNIPLIVLAWLFIGKAFVGKTLWVVTVLSAALDVWSFMPAYEGDKILAALFCGVLSGLGLATVLMTGATSGGTDIVGRLIHKRWPHVSVGKVIMAADGFVVALSALVFKSIESALYAVIVIFISGKVIDTVLYGMGSGKMLMVITEKGRQITEAITAQSPRGVTVIPVTGGYTGEEKQMLICVVRSHEVQKINKIINEIDPQTFMIVSEANEILGKGFNKSI